MAARKTGAGTKSGGFSAAERRAMAARAREAKGDGAGAALAAIAAMPEADRGLAERLHALIASVAPGLAAKTWYGMPAYARDDKVVCFFQSAAKFKTRYATLGFGHAALLDEGGMWPVAFALTAWTAAAEARIGALLERAAG